MKYTKQELINISRENNCGREFYKSCDLWHMSNPHSDFISWIDEDDIPSDIDLECEYHLMSQADYNESIMANTCMYANFEEEFGDKDFKIMVIVLHPLQDFAEQ